MTESAGRQNQDASSRLNRSCRTRPWRLPATATSCWPERVKCLGTGFFIPAVVFFCSMAGVAHHPGRLVQNGIIAAFDTASKRLFWFTTRLLGWILEQRLGTTSVDGIATGADFHSLFVPGDSYYSHDAGLRWLMGHERCCYDLSLC